MRIVVDTNVILSGLLWLGTPHELIKKIHSGQVELVMSPALMDEFANTIKRPKFAAILARTTRSSDQIVQQLRVLADIVAAPPLPRQICRDADDDAVLACAAASGAELIVSGDKDLLILGAFLGVRIVNAAEALRLVEDLEKRIL